MALIPSTTILDTIGEHMNEIQKTELAILTGFYKQAASLSEIGNKVGKFYRFGNTILGMSGGSAALGGVGFLARGALEEKLKEKEDKTMRDKLIAKSPLLLTLLGAGLGGAYGHHAAKKNVGKLIGPLLGIKTASLRKDVKLRDHQKRAIERLNANGGSLLVAHATGSGKTLTGIAGYEDLKKKGKAKKAVVVVPASLRENFVKNLKQFTDSSYSVYGPKGDRRSKNVGDKSSSDYNIISYELFREHGDKVLEDTGADTLIMDEIHRARGTEGVTYNKLLDHRKKVKNAITLTGSVVNNEPNDIVPLMDITYTNKGHRLVSKKFFDKLFVRKDAKRHGIFRPKVHIEKKLKNKNQLAKYLRGKLDFISHEDLSKDMPKREVETKIIPMSKEQIKLYNYTLTAVDPITRWKIRNNLPIGQKEAKAAFAKLMQARQVSTDPSVLDKTLKEKNPEEYSPKVKQIVEDAAEHIKEDKDNKTVIYGNLINGQLGAVEEALKKRGIKFSKFVGLGQEGSTSKTRPEEIRKFNEKENRVLLISGAGAEGLDLKDSTMMQMVEGHYNPERIQQAEARIRRMGSLLHKAPEDRKIKVVRYMAKPEPTGASKIVQKVFSTFGMGGSSGIDKWIYSIAKKKDALNSDFRDTMQKKASSDETIEEMEKRWAREDKEFAKNQKIWKAEDKIMDEFSRTIGDRLFGMMGQAPGQVVGRLAAKPIDKRRTIETEATLKQKLLDKGYEEFTQKRHYNKILSESKMDERTLDIETGINGLAAGLPLLTVLNPKISKSFNRKFIKYLGWAFPRKLIKNPVGKIIIPPLATGFVAGLATEPAIAYGKTLVTRGALSGSTKDVDVGLDRYINKLRKRMEAKYKRSKEFTREVETKKDLGIDIISGA